MFLNSFARFAHRGIYIGRSRRLLCAENCADFDQMQFLLRKHLQAHK